MEIIKEIWGIFKGVIAWTGFIITILVYVVLNILSFGIIEQHFKFLKDREEEQA